MHSDNNMSENIKMFELNFFQFVLFLVQSQPSVSVCGAS